MKRTLEAALLVLAVSGTTGCLTTDTSLSLSSSDPLHVQNQCLQGTNGVAVCPSSIWGTTAAQQPACLATTANCPCKSTFTTPTAIVIDPTQNSTFNNNKSKLKSVKLKTITIDGSASSNGFVNHATALTNAEIVITDQTTNETQTFTLHQALSLLASNSYDPATALSPDPSTIINNAIKGGHPLSIDIKADPTTSATIDVCPIDIDFLFTFAVDLTVNLL